MALRVGGLTRLTTIDFPGRLAAVVFCQGCPWRCGYCHNPDLLDAAAPAALAWDEVLAFLRQRRGLLDGVVFSGGEPLTQSALPEALAQVRALGFATALHTGGMYPDRLAAALPLLDWVGLDIKGPWQRIDTITGVPGSSQRVRQSLQVLLQAGVPGQCRTTWHPGLFAPGELLELARALADLGVRDWVPQACQDARRPGSLQQAHRELAALRGALAQVFAPRASCTETAAAA
ncbi:anaerobic ribonucleoside-triphosphate reductase activating protein [Pulveribacter suum]|uniref:Anaerobic ribonucleoside-triphosphate reductase activating protein n=1 Tax=Pulveribacter suum TaxID=2116657 RepID=A0A2P1NHS1_9BURK|nr:anaerobic ribonucleoside-triphosphate reductase activating protein [Pulveribacter suum]AVP56598.1 anaerobic ribonucleoside-triphosphate reductase activating protein [Pulveribacter suum]